MAQDAAPAIPAVSEGVNGGTSAADDAWGKHPERTLRKHLQRALGREVSFPDDGSVRKATRVVATNPYLVLGAATVGLGVAGVLTAGIAHVVIGAVAAGQLSANGSKVIDRWKSKRQGTVYLDLGAVKHLLSLDSREACVTAVEAVLSGKPLGDVSVTKEDLVKATRKAETKQRLSRAVCALRSPYGRAGLAILAAGLFLIAVTVIPEYIHAPSLRVAAVLSAIGGILIALAVMEAFKDDFDGSSDH